MCWCKAPRKEAEDRLETITAEEIDAMFGANVKGMTLMAKAAAVPMRAQGSGPHHQLELHRGASRIYWTRHLWIEQSGRQSPDALPGRRAQR